MEELLFIIFIILSSLLILVNVAIQRVKLRLKLDRIESPFSPQTWYDNSAYKIIVSEHSTEYQVLIFLLPISLCIVWSVIWYSNPILYSSWPPFVFAVLVLHFSMMIIGSLISRQLEELSCSTNSDSSITP